MSAETLWHLCRASGIVAWLLLTASVVFGAVLSTDLFPRHRRPAWIADLHRGLAGLTVAFVVLHLGTLLADAKAGFTVRDVAVPFAATWRPTAVAAGVLALWALVAIQVTALLARRVAKRFWRDVHVAGYFVFWATCIHAALAGTDAAQPLYRAGMLAGVAAVVFVLVYRILTRGQPRRRSGSRSRPSVVAQVEHPLRLAGGALDGAVLDELHGHP